MAVCKTERYLTPEFNKFQTTCTRRLQGRKLHHTSNTPLTVHCQFKNTVACCTHNHSLCPHREPCRWQGRRKGRPRG